jgi:hypothetical protein
MGTSWEKGQVRKSFPEWKKSRNFFTPPPKISRLFFNKQHFYLQHPPSSMGTDAQVAEIFGDYPLAKSVGISPFRS